MAILNIRNAEVARTFYNGLGASFKESFTLRNGEEGARYYSAFFDEPHGLSEGQRGDVSGLFGAKVNEYTTKDGETKQGVDVTLNSARFSPSDDQPDDDGDSPF